MLFDQQRREGVVHARRDDQRLDRSANRAGLLRVLMRLFPSRASFFRCGIKPPSVIISIRCAGNGVDRIVFASCQVFRMSPATASTDPSYHRQLMSRVLREEQARHAEIQRITVKDARESCGPAPRRRSRCCKLKRRLFTGTADPEVVPGDDDVARLHRLSQTLGSTDSRQCCAMIIV